MQKYIPILMEVYQAMCKENDKQLKIYNSFKRTEYERWNPHNSYKYSPTMLHYMIVIINKLNN